MFASVVFQISGKDDHSKQKRSGLQNFMSFTNALQSLRKLAGVSKAIKIYGKKEHILNLGFSLRLRE